MATDLKAPFPYFGGKSRVADLVWDRLGDVTNYVEPFCGSLAVLLRRPTTPKVETVNDSSHYIANFWRAVRFAPEKVAEWADWPVNECDMHAVHNWLVNDPYVANSLKKVRDTPDYYDAMIAGRWAWGQCCWIGGGWCTDHGSTADGGLKQTLPLIGQTGKGVSKKLKAQLPDISGDSGASGRGVAALAGHKKRPNIADHASGSGVLQFPGSKLPILTGRSAADVAKGLNRGPIGEGRPQLADAFARGRGVNGNDQAETCRERREWLTNWFLHLADRLRVVRVCCGDWIRICDSISTLIRLGLTGVFLDPPYRIRLKNGKANRSKHLYGNDRSQDVDKVVDGVQAWCVKWGAEPLMRIAVCGYEGEGYEILEALGWSVMDWKTQGGYGNRSTVGRENATRERIWFSPACLAPARDRMPLFDALEADLVHA